MILQIALQVRPCNSFLTSCFGITDAKAMYQFSPLLHSTNLLHVALMALEQHELLFLQSMWRLTDPHPLTTGLWKDDAYQVTLTDCPEHSRRSGVVVLPMALGPKADS